MLVQALKSRSKDVKQQVGQKLQLWPAHAMEGTQMSAEVLQQLYQNDMQQHLSPEMQQMQWQQMQMQQMQMQGQGQEATEQEGYEGYSQAQAQGGEYRPEEEDEPQGEPRHEQYQEQEKYQDEYQPEGDEEMTDQMHQQLQQRMQQQMQQRMQQQIQARMQQHLQQHMQNQNMQQQQQHQQQHQQQQQQQQHVQQQQQQHQQSMQHQQQQMQHDQYNQTPQPPEPPRQNQNPLTGAPSEPQRMQCIATPVLYRVMGAQREVHSALLLPPGEAAKTTGLDGKTRVPEAHAIESSHLAKVEICFQTCACLIGARVSEVLVLVGEPGSGKTTQLPQTLGSDSCNHPPRP